MIVTSDDRSPYGVRIMRMPSEIREEIIRVNQRIAVLNGQIDVREMLGEMLLIANNESSERCIAELEDIIESARESLAELDRLKKSLEILADELEESKWLHECS